MEGVDTSDEAVLMATQKIQSGIARLAKDKLKCRFEYMSSIISGLRGKSSGPLPSAAEALENVNDTEEQIELDYELVDESAETLESADEDNDQIYMNNLYDEVFGESFEEDDFMEGYQEMLESAEESDEFSEEDDFMEGYQEMLESTDDSFESMTSEFEERMNNLLED